MSFQREANRFLLLLSGAGLVGSVVTFATPVFLVFGSLLFVGAAGGVMLPTVSIVLDRAGLARAPYGRRLRRVGIGMAILLLGLAALTMAEVEGLGRLAGLILAAWSLAVATVAWRRPVVDDPPAASPDAPRFGATVIGTALMVFGFLLIPKFSHPRDHAYQRQMESDLRNLAWVQQEHFDSTGSYAEDPSVGGRFEPSREVRVRMQLTRDGWAAQASHSGVEGSCTIVVEAPTDWAEIARQTDCSGDGPSTTGRVVAGLATAFLMGATLLLVVGAFLGRSRYRIDRNQAVQDVTVGGVSAPPLK